MSDVVDELVAAVARARAADDAADAAHEEVRVLLVQVRRTKPDMKLPEIEEKIGRYWDRGTISRKTAPELGLSGKQA